jgi:site-specific recombinase XerD
MHEIIAIDRQPDWSKLVQLVLDSVSSPASKRAYGSALRDFLAWYRSEPRPPFSKAVVQAHKAHLEARGLAPASINIRLSAIRKLATEAADNGLMAPELAAGVARVKGAKRQGVRMGNWLTKGQAEALLNSPDTARLKGKRDRALLCVLVGCGLRRSEAVNLTFNHVQQREARWIVLDLVGKHGRVRSVPMPAWAKAAIEVWATAAGLSEGRIFRAMNKGDRIIGETLNDKAVACTLALYAEPLGLKVAAHDLRRTYAKLAHTGRAALEQIQLSLGHSSIQTTERYLGVRQDLQDAPCDHLGLKVAA